MRQTLLLLVVVFAVSVFAADTSPGFDAKAFDPKPWIPMREFGADGSNEMMGIQPDVSVAFSAVDGGHLRGARFMAKLPEAVERVGGLRK